MGRYAGVLLAAAALTVATAGTAASAEAPDVAWTDQFGTSSWDEGRGVAVSPQGTVTVTGYTDGALPGQTSSGDADVFVRQYHRDGSVAWTDQFGSSSCDWGYGVAVSPQGTVTVTGYTGGALPGQTSSGSGDVFVRQYHRDGSVAWTDQFGTSSWDEEIGRASCRERV